MDGRRQDGAQLEGASGVVSVAGVAGAQYQHQRLDGQRRLQRQVQVRRRRPQRRQPHQQLHALGRHLAIDAVAALAPDGVHLRICVPNPMSGLTFQALRSDVIAAIATLTEIGPLKKS